MDQQRFELINEVFNDALDVDPKKRADFLSAACENDPLLRRAVEHKLDAYVRGTLLPRNPMVADKDTTGMMLDRGTVLEGRFEITRILGEGGMGIVYEAEDKKDGLGNRKVAVKQAWPEFRELFQREARRLSLLNHPGIPKVYDLVCVGENRFLVMEYIAGKTLGELLRKRAEGFDRREVLDWARALLRTLDYLHTFDPSDERVRRRDVKPTIHRDVKPENLMLSHDGHLYLLDFGIARDGAWAETKDLRTARGLITPAYGPPEQSSNLHGEISVRSDLYALGATVFHLLSNEPPPPAAYRLGSQADPLDLALRAHEKQIPEALAAWLQRSMALKPDERPESAAAMLRELENAINSLDRPEDGSTAVEKQHRSNLALKTTFLALAAVTLVAALLYMTSVSSDVSLPNDVQGGTETRNPPEANASATLLDDGVEASETDNGSRDSDVVPEPIVTAEGGDKEPVSLQVQRIKANFVFVGGTTRGVIEINGRRVTQLSGHELPVGTHQIAARSGTLDLEKAVVHYREGGHGKTVDLPAEDGSVDLNVEPNWDQLRIVLHLN